MYIQGMRFVWDERKRKSNLRKHGFDFQDCEAMFKGPFLFAEDRRQDYGETRYIGIGALGDRIATLVFSTPDEESIRVISMRKATPAERSTYYDSR